MALRIPRWRAELAKEIIELVGFVKRRFRHFRRLAAGITRQCGTEMQPADRVGYYHAQWFAQKENRLETFVQSDVSIGGRWPRALSSPTTSQANSGFYGR